MVQTHKNGPIDAGAIYSDIPSFFTDGPDSAMHNEEFDVPEELVALLDEHGLSTKGRAFRVLLKEVPEGTDDSTGAYINSWSRAVPSTQWIAMNYGPGDYILQFQWRGKDEESGKIKNFSEKLPLKISEKYRDKYEDYQYERRITRMQNRRKKVSDARLEKDLESDLNPETGDNDKKQNAREYLEEIKQVADMFGWRTGQSQGAGLGGLFEKLAPILPAVIAYLDSKARQQRENDMKMLTLLSGMANNSNQQLIDVLKNQNGPSSGSDIMKEISTMLFGALDIKDALSGQKKSPLDKVLETVEGVLPVVLTLSQQSKAQREQNLMYKQAAGFINKNPDFQAVMNDPELLAAAVQQWDGHYGWEQTDAILTVAGIERPDSCPRSDEQRYPAGDERNGAQDAEVEAEQEE